jgi:cytoskeleton protein RodZ
MKVPVKKLEALEADRLDQTSDAVFVRALASGVCRALKIDPVPILERLPRSPIPRLNREERVVNTAFTVPTASRSWSLPDILTKPAAIGVIALVVGAGVLLLLPDSMSRLGRGEHVQVPVVNEPSPATAGTNMANVPVTTLTANPAEAASAPFVMAEASQAAAAGKSASAPAGPDVAGSASGLVAFHVRGSSWVEVTDSRGVVQLRKTLQSGERAAASGELPLSVIIGRADVTEVEVRGKPFALDTVAKENVARFEVK